MAKKTDPEPQRRGAALTAGRAAAFGGREGLRTETNWTRGPKRIFS